MRIYAYDMGVCTVALTSLTTSLGSLTTYLRINVSTRLKELSHQAEAPWTTPEIEYTNPTAPPIPLEAITVDAIH